MRERAAARRSEEFIRVDTRIAMDPKIRSLGHDKLAGVGALLLLTAESRAILSDGLIRKSHVHSILHPAPPEQVDDIITLLAAEGLIEDHDDAWYLCGYANWQQASTQVRHQSEVGAAAARARWGDACPECGKGVGTAHHKRTCEPGAGSPATATPSVDEPGQRPDVDVILHGVLHYIGLGLGEAPKATKTGRKAIRLLLDTDGRDPAEVKQVAAWLGNPGSWWGRGRIQSPTKFREKYLTIRAEMVEHAARGAGTGSGGRPPAAALAPVTDLVTDPTLTVVTDGTTGGVLNGAA